MSDPHKHKDGGTTYHLYALHYRVLCVAVVHEEHKEWGAYVKDVPGERHEDEWQDVAATGAKLRPEVAAALWPHLAKKHKWRN